MQKQLNSTITILLTRFNGQVLIPFAAAVTSVGFVEQSARNMLVKHSFPIPSVLSGGRRFIPIQNLAEYVDSLGESKITKTKRGRRTKASKIAQRVA